MQYLLTTLSLREHSSITVSQKECGKQLKVDGCGTIRYFFKIVVPLSKAIIAVIGLWTAVGIWNSWFNALIYLTKENLQPLQLILRRLLISNQMMQSQATGELASDLRIKADMMKYAAIVISTAPIMLLYPFVQKYFQSGCHDWRTKRIGEIL